MPRDYIPAKDTVFQDWLGNFISIATAADLVANIAGAGAYLLTWDRAGNSPNTLFVIEAKIGTAPDWLPVFTTTKTKYEHTGNPAGFIFMLPSVKAQRGEIQSPPINVAVVN